MVSKPVLVWFQNDLRLSDNPALDAAAKTGPVVPVYVWSPEEEAPWEAGAASRVWLHASLSALQERLCEYGSRLLLRRGDTLAALLAVARECGAGAVYWNRRYEPHLAQRNRQIEAALRGEGLDVRTFNASLLVEPELFLNKQGAPYQVFTPFYKRALRDVAVPAPLPAPRQLAAPEDWPGGDSLAALELMPRVDWTGGIRRAWRAGSTQARQSLDTFLGEGLADYPDKRDVPASPSVSRLSPHLHFGEISPRQVVHTVQGFAGAQRLEGMAEAYIRQVYWREFAHYLLWHFPHTTEKPLQQKFALFPWREDRALLEKWQRGMTGFPLVDAGMRELWETGWMHNRVRMVAASFLVKDLLQPWQAGARWFWDTLVDADLANNTLGWQWVAGCGADAAPYFRIFNPVSQGEKFDPEGAYVRRWVPELAKLPDKWLHQPWTAPGAVLGAAGVRPGKTYPEPLVDHAEARELALEGYNAIK